ncbi:hypothetical protein Q8A67_001620 [Cirrhinus molitorella]|uniref:Nuclear Testis protein N-terminal domain-containing protein n=1 Tax=Cirrhinus molitorella TaxID=172907 RepID=A0AA88Q6Q5_9TELE|nr:hypothetical protein Q8A67_001620 [Cirrhinus molitorella]
MDNLKSVTEETEAAVLSLLQYEQEHMNPKESNASVHSLPKLHEELEGYHQGFQPTFEDPRPSVLSEAFHCASSLTHINNICQPPNLNHFPTSVHQEKQTPHPLPLNIKPVTLLTNINLSFANPHLNPSWPVLVPHLNPNIPSNASVPHHNPFCPNHTPKLNFNPPFKANFTAPVAREDHSYSPLVLKTHLNVYPVCPTPNIYQPNVQAIRRNGGDSGRFPRDLQDSFSLWQRLCETARLFCSSCPDAEALACFFMRVVPSLSVYSPDLPFSAAVNIAVQEWRNTSNFEREQYYNSARMFIEMEEQANRDPTNPQTDKSKVKKTGRPRSKKASFQDLTENALSEYSQVMDALESKVTDGSELADEEDICALFLNQMLNESESTTEAGFDMDYISSLLSTDVLKDNSQDAFSSMIPEPVAGCSDWTHTMVSKAQIWPRPAVQRDFNLSEGTKHLLFKNQMVENALVPFLDNMNAFQTEPLLVNPEGQSSESYPNTSICPELGCGNPKDETLFVAELDSAAQSSCFNLQNYNSHHATFPETPIDGGVEHFGEENEKYMHVESAEDNKNTDLDMYNDSQRTRDVQNKQKTIDKIEENDVTKNKKHKRRHRRRKHQNITVTVERTSPKSDHKDARRLKTTGETQGDSAMEGRRGNLCQHDKQIGKTRGRLDRIERQQRHFTTKTERDGGKTYRGPKKQENVLVQCIEEDRGDFRRRTDVLQRLRRKKQAKAEKRWMK